MRSRVRSFFALFGVLMLAATALVALASPAVADTIGPVDASIPDGDPGSLRDVVENEINDGDVVVLEAGAIYTLTCDGGGNISTGAEFTLQGNGATILEKCDTYVVEINYETTFDDVTITGGYDDDNRSAGAIHVDSDSFTVLNSSIVGNQTCGAGGAIVMDEGDFLRIENSTIAGNTAAENGGAIASYGGSESIVEIVNSTITGNSGGWGGAIDQVSGGDLSLTYVTLAGNTADFEGIPCESDLEAADDPHGAREPVQAQANGSGANIQFDDEESVLTTFGSVIALPVEGPNCSGPILAADALSSTVSHGYNFSDDSSCDLTGTGDRQSAGDPALTALGPNGGPTETRPPTETSPLVDGVPLAQCQADGAAGISWDQRGITRPQRNGCDIGAVELVFTAPTPTPEPLPLVVTPRFTG